MQPQQWEGSKPQRFSGGRKHLQMEDELNRFFVSSSRPQPQGIRTFIGGPTPEQQFKPIVKIFPNSYIPQQKEIDLRGKKPLFLGQQKERFRKEKGHVQGGSETENQLRFKGIKTFEQSNGSKNNHYSLESRMQAKIRIFGLEEQRNKLGVSSMGDKAYKYPEYASGFFNDGGLIAGSTGFKLRAGDNTQPDANKLKSIFTKPMWTEKVKMEEKQEQKHVLDSVDNWEKTTLIEGNPKWNDPETFFERLEKEAKPAGGKDIKKGAKK